MQAVIDKLGGMEGVDRFLRGGLVIKAVKLLRQVAEVSVVGTKEFVAARAFDIANPKVSITYLDDAFKANFLGKTEKNFRSIVLAVHCLVRPSSDEEIRAELGLFREETTLANLYELLLKQPKGESGPLLTNRHVNLFYIYGIDDNLWTVNVRWCDYSRPRRGWHVHANLVGEMHEWRNDLRVISCK